MKNKINLLQAVLILCCIVFILLPLGKLAMTLSFTECKALFAQPLFQTALKNSLYCTTVATVLTVTLALLLAWAIERSNIKRKNTFVYLLTIPMLIPSISHGMGLIVLFGANGILTQMLHLPGAIYGTMGIILGSFLYAFPIALLMTLDILRYENGWVYEAAEILGIPKWRQWRDITLPYLYKPLISVVFAVFTIIVTDYGVPLMIGGKTITLPVFMYQEVIGLLDFPKGGIVGFLLLLPAVVAFIVDLTSREPATSAYTTKKVEPMPNKHRDMFAYLVAVGAAYCILIPILVFIPLTLLKKYPIDLTFTTKHIFYVLQMKGGEYLLNALFIAIVVSIIGTVGSFLTAYLTVRIRTKISRLLHLAVITSLAIPGIVLGLSYAQTFNGTVIYGTVAILILVNLVHFFASPYLMMYNTLGKINPNLEAVGTTLGIGKLRIIKDVIVPQTKTTIMEMSAYYFVNCTMTISAVAFLANSNNKPIALLITQLEGQMLLECSAFVSVVILTVNLIVKAIIGFAKKHADKEPDYAHKKTI